MESKVGMNGWEPAYGSSQMKEKVTLPIGIMNPLIISSNKIDSVCSE